MFYFVKTPSVIKKIYKDVHWNFPNVNKEIFLTFDDGPTEGITDEVLSILDKFNAKATFFCVGEDIKKNPTLFKRLQSHGHAIGNHSYSHLKGWNTSNEKYFEDIQKCQKLTQTSLFRPPYGKATRKQLALLNQDYKIILWDVLSGDFDPTTSIEKIIKNVIGNVESGSIIVMHDNLHCGEKMLKALPFILEGLLQKGFSFSRIQ